MRNFLHQIVLCIRCICEHFKKIVSSVRGTVTTVHVVLDYKKANWTRRGENKRRWAVFFTVSTSAPAFKFLLTFKLFISSWLRFGRWYLFRNSSVSLRLFSLLNYRFLKYAHVIIWISQCSLQCIPFHL